MKRMILKVQLKSAFKKGRRVSSICFLSRIPPKALVRELIILRPIKSTSIDKIILGPYDTKISMACSVYFSVFSMKTPEVPFG